MSSVGCSTLVTCALPMLPARSPAGPEVVRDAVVAWDGGALTYAGPRSGWSGPVDEELTRRTVVPGLWAGPPEGGVRGSARPRPAGMPRHGTTTLELKTGYGLSVEAELRQARLARRLAEELPQTATVTLLACHAVPEGMNREAWVDAVRAELIPTAAREGLVDAVDVYVEDIAFSTDDLERVAETAAGVELPLRVHADRVDARGGRPRLRDVRPGAPGGTGRGDGEPRVGPRPARPPRLAGAGEAGRLRGPGHRRVPAGAVPPGPQPSGGGVPRRRAGPLVEFAGWPARPESPRRPPWPPPSWCRAGPPARTAGRPRSRSPGRGRSSSTWSGSRARSTGCPWRPAETGSGVTWATRPPAASRAPWGSPSTRGGTGRRRAGKRSGGGGGTGGCTCSSRPRIR